MIDSDVRKSALTATIENARTLAVRCAAGCAMLAAANLPAAALAQTACPGFT